MGVDVGDGGRDAVVARQGTQDHAQLEKADGPMSQPDQARRKEQAEGNPWW
jgi:hypothetical protein